MRSFTQNQLDLIHRPLNARLFLEGPAGAGKTSAAAERMLHLMAQGVPGSSILVLVPQRTLAEPYYAALNTPGASAGGRAAVLTLGGLARRMVEVFWPLIAEQAGFAHPERLPVFLTLETAQYFMARVTRPLFEQGYFASLTIDRNRLYSQVLDNLNKAALVGFPCTEIGERLKAAWSGGAGQYRVYDDAQDCAERFRCNCLENNRLDFSLQLEVFHKSLWPNRLCRGYLQRTFRHLITDNIEEDTPLSHDLLGEWLPEFDSALLVYDQDGGYRTFLGADPHSAYALGGLCDERVVFAESRVVSARAAALQPALSWGLGFGPPPVPMLESPLSFESARFYPDMLEQISARVASLVRDDGVHPGEIAVLSPYLSDALRFALLTRLEQHGIPARTQRPSRALREEPAATCLITLAYLAHPGWAIDARLTYFDLAYALLQTIEGIDLVRAQLLSQIVFRSAARKGQSRTEPGSVPAVGIGLSPFEIIDPAVQERITYRLGEKYDGLRYWLEEYSQAPQVELDIFFSRLFGEVLSQPGYGFHTNLFAGEVTANLIESVRKFRWAAGEGFGGMDSLAVESDSLGREYLLMVREGVIAAQYVRSWQGLPADEDAVMVMPAYTFLMNNRPVDVQVWLDAGSSGWFERLHQPLTQPYVLSRRWPPDKAWTSDDELEASNIALHRLVTGCLRRCRQKVIVGINELGEQGYEQRGPLLRAVQRVLQQAAQAGAQPGMEARGG